MKRSDSGVVLEGVCESNNSLTKSRGSLKTATECISEISDSYSTFLWTTHYLLEFDALYLSCDKVSFNLTSSFASSAVFCSWQPM